MLYRFTVIIIIIIFFLTHGTYWSRGSLKIKIDTKDGYDHSVSAVIGRQTIMKQYGSIIIIIIIFS